VRYQPKGLRDPRTAGSESPFASDDGMEALMRGAGASTVRTVVEPAVLEFPDVATWHRFSMSTGQRAMWMNVPDTERGAILDEAASILDRTRSGGPALLTWQMRYTLGETPSD
jgi:hypothetical protein